MKKNLLFLFALICSVTLFTACGDDEKEDNSWQELPKGEIAAEKIDLQLNGATTTGTVDFKATSLATAEVEFKNVIDGYSDVTVDVKMDKQIDGSFKLSGTKEITTKPVVATRAAAFLTVTVDGAIATDGKLTMSVKVDGAGLYIGTYSGKTLVLSYGKTLLVGKEAIFDATDGDNVSLLLKDVIPGESATTITGVKVANGAFSGTFTASTADVAYEGALKDKVLTLNVNVTMKDPDKLAKSYSLGEYALDGKNIKSSPLFFGYANSSSSEADSHLTHTIFRGVGAILLPQLLKSVTFEADGNIRAEYSSRAIVADMDMLGMAMFGSAPTVKYVTSLIPTDGWKVSPKSYVYWFAKDGKVYVKLDVATIVSQALGDAANAELLALIPQILAGDAATVKALLGKLAGFDLSMVSDDTIKMLQSWITNGIPLNVKVENGYTSLYLDRSAFDPIFIDKKYQSDGSLQGNNSDAMKLFGALMTTNLLPEEIKLVGIVLQGLVGQWSETSTFDVGLNLKP